MISKYEVRSINPDYLIRAGFPTLEAAQAWIAARGKVAAFAYYATRSQTTR